MMKQNYISPAVVSVVLSALMAENVLLPISGVVDRENQGRKFADESLLDTWPESSAPWGE